MREIYTEMAESLKRGESFAVATVVATKGSTPRKAGAKMLFFPGGRTVFVAQPNDSFDLIDLMLVTSLHVGNSRKRPRRR